MTKMRMIALAALAGLALTGSQAQAWCRGPVFGIGINLGPPCYRPWGYYDYYYYRPYPVYVAPPPVVVQPAPVVVQPTGNAPVAQRSASEPAPELHPVNYDHQADVDRYLQQLADPNDQTRMAALMELGKMKAVQAVDPVAATLAGDVRDAAARALGLIGSPRALMALKYAAQADGDRDVRHSAAFAVDVIQSNMKR
jgi:hypothetical protein